MKNDGNEIERLTLLAVLEILWDDGFEMQQLIDMVRVHVMAPPAKSHIAGISPYCKPAIIERLEVLVERLPKI